MKRRKFGLIICLVLVFTLVLGGCGGGCGKEKPEEQEREALSVDDVSDNQIVEEDPTESLNGTQDIAFFGVDTRGTNLGKGTRSDSIMIVHIDHDAKTIRVASVYRDCLTYIEGHGYQKITHAHSYGGPELAVETINSNFDLDVENYITVNFINVADFVDEIGGIEQEITEEEAAAINGSITELNNIRGTSSASITSAGTYTLDGSQAVAYSRIRHASGGDYKRSERQRTILFKMFETLKSMDLSTRISVAEDMVSQINTNLTRSQVTDLMVCLSGYEISEMTAYPQVFYGGTVDGVWVEVPVTLTDMASGLHEFLYGEEDYAPSDTVSGYSVDMQAKAGTANNDLRETSEEE